MKIEKEYKYLGSTIRNMRIRAGLNQTKAAKLIGLSRVSLTQIEGGNQRMLYHSALRILSKLKTKSGWKRKPK